LKHSTLHPFTKTVLHITDHINVPFIHMTSRYQDAIYNPTITARQSKGKMTSTSTSTTSYPDHKWYSFLLPTNEPQSPVRIYDAPLRRRLFHHAKAGNEETQTARRRSSAASTESNERRQSRAFEAASALNLA